MNDDGSLSTSELPATSGWMIPGLLGPYLGTQERTDARREVLFVALAPARAARLAEAIGVAGFRVRIARSVSEAVALISAAMPDLVLLGAGCLDASQLVGALAESYRRGSCPQLVTDPGEAEDATCARLASLLEQR